MKVSGLSIIIQSSLSCLIAGAITEGIVAGESGTIAGGFVLVLRVDVRAVVGGASRVFDNGIAYSITSRPRTSEVSL